MRATRRKFYEMAARVEQLVQQATRASLLALVLALGGCSASEVVQNWTPATAVSTMNTPADLPQPNHRRVVGDNIKTILPRIETLGDLEISGSPRVSILGKIVLMLSPRIETLGDLEISGARPEISRSPRVSI